jgi:undecaprenyl-diphosphatase
MSAVLSYLTESDLRLSWRLLGWAPPRWFRLWMITATKLGDGWLWVAAGLTLVAGGGACHRALGASALAAGIANLALLLLKRSVRRKRPCDYRSHSHFHIQPFAYFPSDRFSFPSGHALNAFSIGTVLSLSFPSLAPGIALLAVSVAASRVVLGLHFLSDVLAGAALGTLIGSSVFVFLLR